MTLNTTLLFSQVISQLRWDHVVFVTDNTESNETQQWLRHLYTCGMTQVVMTGSEALSGKWVRRMTKTGENSWRPLNVVMLCSLPCLQSALHEASSLEREYGTLTALGMASRWLLIPTGGDSLLDHLYVHNITMNNVAIVDVARDAKLGACDHKRRIIDGDIKLYTLVWQKDGREWAYIASIITHNHNVTMENIHMEHGVQRSFKTMKYLVENGADMESQMFPNIRKGYNGRHLRIVIKEWGKYVMSTRQNGTKMWEGIFLNLLTAVSETLNFTYHFVEPEDGLWGTGTAKDADVGFFGYVINKKVDLGVAPCDIIFERAQLMDFASPVSFTSSAMVYRKPEAGSDLQSLLGPLSLTVLVALGGALLLVSLLVLCMEMASIAGERRVLEAGGDLLAAKVLLPIADRVFLATGAALLSEPCEVRLRSRSGRVLLFSWWMFSLVMAAAYSGTLTAFLSVTKDRQLFNNLQDLLTKEHDYQWGTVRGVSPGIVLENSKNPLLSDIWKGMQRFASSDPTVLSQKETEMLDKVLTEDFVFMTVKSLAEEKFGENCSVAIVDAGIKQGLLSVVLPKGSALTKPISVVIERLHAIGILAKWNSDFFPRRSCSTAPRSEVISLHHMRGVLFLVPLALGLATVVLIVEIIHRRWRRRDNRAKDIT